MSTFQVSTQFLLASIEKSMSKFHELLPSHKQIIRKLMKKKHPLVIQHCYWTWLYIFNMVIFPLNMVIFPLKMVIFHSFFVCLPGRAPVISEKSVGKILRTSPDLALPQASFSATTCATVAGPKTMVPGLVNRQKSYRNSHFEYVNHL